MSVFHLLSHNGLKALIDKITAYFYTKSQTDDLLDDKVDKVDGKGLSTEDYTTAEKTKLSNIEAGAEVNVQSDWNESDNTKDGFIKNKPTLRQPSADGTAGQYLKSNGSGNAPSWETMDSSPTANSTKAVTSGGVKTALDGKQASISITTKTDDAGDNDKVIMQASGVTDTTTFVRRSLTNIRDWLLKKLIPEELLKWGGLNGQGERTALGVIDSTLINNIRANRVAWLTADHFAVEYSRDGGTTWQNSRHIDDIMNWTSSPTGTNIYIGDADAEHIATSAYMTRITLTTAPSPASSNNYTFYCKIVKMCFYVATMGSTGCKLNVYLRTQANVESNTDTWMHVAEDCALTGWSGWNIINFPSGITTYGNNKSAQYGQIRMVFSADGYSGNGTTNYGLSLQRLRVYAPDCRGVGNSLANYDSPFAFYADRHVVFPSTVTATQLIKSGGTDSQLLVADGSVIRMPIAIAKGGTGATTAFNAEYNINTNVRNSHLTGDISDNSRIPFCSTAPSTTNGVFAGYRTMSQVWNWIKTHFDTAPTANSDNPVTSGGVYSALEEKVNLQPDFTASQIDYSAGNVGKWQKVLRFPDGADLVINMKKTVMGSDTTSTLWYSSSSIGESYTSLFGNHSVRFVRDGGYVFLCLACRKSTNEPIESYTFQIAHSSVPMSDIVAVTDASPITATPKEPSIVYRAPMTTGAVSFNVNNGAGSVAMANHNDFLGNMTAEASDGVTVTMSGATEGQIYRFVFTRNITGGVTFKQSNVAYCTIQGDVNAGDTITLTAVSNTADGWLYEQESAGIESSDGSNIIEYNGSTADVRVNWDKLPARVVMNVAGDDYEDDKNIAIGYEASTYKLTGDENNPYAYTTKAELLPMKVDGGEEEYTHAVTAGTTYSIVRGGVTTSFTPAHSGYAVLLELVSGYELATGNGYISQLITPTYTSTVVLYDATESGSAPYQIVVASINSTYISRVVEGSYMLAWYMSGLRQNALALGRGASATGMAAAALGQKASAKDLESVAVGNEAKAMGLYSTAVGRNSVALGYQATAYGARTYARKRQSTALGAYAESDGQYASAIGTQAKANSTYATAIGFASQALVLSTTVVGYANTAYNALSAVVGINSSTGGVSGDSERPYLTAKAFSGAKFSTGGNEVYNAFVPSGGDIVITVGGTSYTLTSPSELGRMLFVINEADAQYIHRSLINPLELDGVLVDNGGTPTNENAVIEHLSGNCYAVWIRYSSSNPVVSTQSLKFYASVTRTSNDSTCASVGSYNSVMNSESVAVGTYLCTIQNGQTIFGRYNKPVEGYFIVGNGANSNNGRKNCLVIDPSERLVINAGYVGGTQTIDMNQQNGSLSNITKAVYRIRWDGTGTVNLTLGTNGCVEGQRVTIFAETNDVSVSGKIIVTGRYMDFVFIAGDWRAPQDPWQ